MESNEFRSVQRLNQSKKVIVISAISLFNGGAYSILKTVLRHLSNNSNYRQYQIIVLVYKNNFLENFPNIEFIEFTEARDSWFKKLWYEYSYFKKLSKELKPYLWLSLHDITPNVEAVRRAVYCHNSYPFASLSIKSILLEPSFFIFNIFYKLIYRINIHKNNYVIVQQDWLRVIFNDLFKVSKEKIIVSQPTNTVIVSPVLQSIEKSSVIRFFYPVFPRVFKNFEIICEALMCLEKERRKDIKMIFTFDGTENKYAQYIYEKYRHLNCIDFIGYQRESQLNLLYHQADFLIFPSKVETWGLPITEFKAYKKPIILADLPYARETLGNYDKVLFFNPLEVQSLVDIFERILSKRFFPFEENEEKSIKAPFAAGWEGLFNILLK